MRKHLRMSQHAFATGIGVSRSYLGDVEAGRCEPSAALLTAITSKVRGSVDWILTGQGEMFRPTTVIPSSMLSAPQSSREAADRRVESLLSLLDAINAEDRDNIIADAFARAKTAQQMTVLLNQVGILTAKVLTGR